MSGPFDLAAALNALTPKQRGDVMKEQEVIAVIQDAVYGKSKGKQTDQWTFEALMLSGDWEGETVDGVIYWSTKAAQMATASLAALGATTEWVLENKPDPDEIADKLRGAKFVGNVVINEYRGRKSNRIEPKEYLGHEGGGQTYGGLEEFGAETSSNPEPGKKNGVTPPAATKEEAPSGAGDAVPESLDSDDLWSAAQ